MTIILRTASTGDCNELFKLASQLATSYVLERDAFAKAYSSLVTAPHVDLVIAESDSTVVGYVLAFHHQTFYANGMVSWVEEIFVQEEFRRQNIGNQLMNEVEARAHKRGSKLVALATRRAAHFYESIGYKESATYYKKSL
ncbi:acetyltransferase (GNAT) family protein [Paenibacillus cellulosilyticus]|uniref:Acetyltransferase (GNAT) family protein n=1 Tax=Paenibacillus cellulosilyticus TaxID=375489 RepID=A0A2V2YPY0_9BACL|nr:GNAT family N-acetyltransferase [Paenibacillus cellulosilyticus]PWV94501.1 acetyltransferase (GNAT) family protein [Paenibacillus cellulosilyticus]QKS45011.1 GNAT family N-acetyltransferase [Paenibacillus cellulosilyticus]